MKGTLQIKCLSDVCFSVPAPLSAAVDTEVAVDASGLPFVSGKTLHGLLTDAYLTVRQHLDRKGLGPNLLGRRGALQERSVLRIGDGFLSDVQGNDLRIYLCALLEEKRRLRSPLPQEALRSAFLALRTLTAQERATDAPKKETLRSIRVLPRCTILEAPLETTRPLTTDEETLLLRLIQITRHVGAHRNRGLGAVHMTLAWKEDTSPLVSVEPIESTPQGVRFLHYRVTLNAPCLIADHEMDPNSRTTKSYLSGGAVRGAVAAALVRRNASLSEIERIIASGAVRFLNAYPEADRVRALPTPITWRRTKNPLWEDTDWGAALYDAVKSLCNPDGINEPPSEQQEPVKTEFVAPAGGGFAAAAVKRRFVTHHRRVRRSGATSKESEATVFVYEALEAQQCFQGCIAFPRGAMGDRMGAQVAEILQRDALWLGRSRRSGYGGAPAFEILSQTHPDREAAIYPYGVGEGEEFLVWLTAAAVLRDPKTGQHDPYRLKQELEARFRGLAKVQGVCLSPTVVRSFNRLWRTEMPAVPAAAAGSVALLRARRDISEEALTKTQSRAIGERVAEGYGCFVAQALNSFSGLSAAAPPPVPVPEGATPPALTNAQERLYGVRLRLLVEEQAYLLTLRVPVSTLPSVSLLRRYREPLRAAHEDAWRSEYRAWFPSDPEERSVLRDRARERAQRAWLDGGTLADLLQQASEADWKPPLGRYAADEQTRYRIVPVEEAQRIWDRAGANSALCVSYLDTLLSLLARAKRQEPTTR